MEILKLKFYVTSKLLPTKIRTYHPLEILRFIYRRSRRKTFLFRYHFIFHIEIAVTSLGNVTDFYFKFYKLFCFFLECFLIFVIFIDLIISSVSGLWTDSHNTINLI